MLFYTEYIVGGVTFSQTLIARDEEDANRLVLLRNIGETIVGFPQYNAPDIFVPETADHLYQELAITAWIHVKSGAGPDDVIGPTGWFTQYMASRFSPLEPVIPAANKLLVATNEVRSFLGLPRFKRITP